MVTFFSDRIPVAMLFELVWKRQPFWQQFNFDRPRRPYEVPASTRLEAIATRSVEQRSDTRRQHDAPSLARLRHLWYRDAVERDARYDSHYFVRSGEWVEPKCADPLCALCKDRPDRHPSPRRPRAVPIWLVNASDAPVEAGRTSR